MKPISNHKPQVEPRKNNEISGLLHEIKSLEDRVNKLNIMYNDLRKITEDLKKEIIVKLSTNNPYKTSEQKCKLN